MRTWHTHTHFSRALLTTVSKLRRCNTPPVLGDSYIYVVDKSEQKTVLSASFSLQPLYTTVYWWQYCCLLCANCHPQLKGGGRTTDCCLCFRISRARSVSMDHQPLAIFCVRWDGRAKHGLVCKRHLVCSTLSSGEPRRCRGRVQASSVTVLEGVHIL